MHTFFCISSNTFSSFWYQWQLLPSEGRTIAHSKQKGKKHAKELPFIADESLLKNKILKTKS